MLNYVIRRLLLVPVLLLGVTILIFAMLSVLSPVERASLYVRDVPKNERQLEGIIRKYKLDRPIYEQYWLWLVGQKDRETGEYIGGIIRGNFGYSQTASQPIADMIKLRFPATVELALWSVLPILGVGVWLGVLSALNHNRFIDQAGRVFSILGWSFPTFVFGLLVLMIFYAKLGWFPPGRLSDWANQIIITGEEFTSYTHLVTVDALLNGRMDIFWDALRHLFLPIVTLSYLSWALMLRVTRSSMLDVLRQEYITTARSKGLSRRAVIWQHAVPNGLIPVITIGGGTVVGLLNGVVITETIFNYPGIGSATAEAALHLDVVTVLAMSLFTGFILIVANLIVDILYGVVDPRVRLS